MDMIGRIRRLHSRKNKSAREISRITGLSRNTVAKWLHGEVDAEDRGHIAVGLGAEHAHGTRRAVFGDQHPAQLVGDIKALGRRQAGVGAGNQTVAAHVEAFTIAAHAHPESPRTGV